MGDLQLLKLQLPLRRSYLHLNLFWGLSGHAYKNLHIAGCSVRVIYCHLMSEYEVYMKCLVHYHVSLFTS